MLFVRRLLLASLGLVGCVLLGSPGRSQAQTLPGPTQPGAGISVVGQGIVLAQPNTAHITLGSEVFDQSLASAQSEAGRRMDAVLAKLKSDGIADADIRTVAYNVNPQYDSRDPNQPTLRGYQVQNLVDVRTTNVSGLGPLIDDAIAAGATRVYGVRFEA